jgi:hypothetical protein
MRSGFGSEYTHLLLSFRIWKTEFFNKKWLTTNEDVACKKIIRCTNRAPIMDFEEHNLTKLSINGLIR